MSRRKGGGESSGEEERKRESAEIGKGDNSEKKGKAGIRKKTA